MSLIIILLNDQLYYFIQIETSGADSENIHKSHRLEYHCDKNVIRIVMFSPTWHILNVALAYVRNIMKKNVWRMSTGSIS